MAGIIAEGKDPTPCACIIMGVIDTSAKRAICIGPQDVPTPPRLIY